MVKITTLAGSTKGHDVFKDPQAVAIDLTSGALFTVLGKPDAHRACLRLPSGGGRCAAGRQAYRIHGVASTLCFFQTIPRMPCKQARSVLG